jgi:hypothetical protein
MSSRKGDQSDCRLVVFSVDRIEKLTVWGRRRAAFGAAALPFAAAEKRGRRSQQDESADHAASQNTSSISGP